MTGFDEPQQRVTCVRGAPELVGGAGKTFSLSSQCLTFTANLMACQELSWCILKKEEFLTMPHSVDSPLRFWDFPSTNCGLRTFKGLFFILWLSLCLLAGCEGSKQVPAAFLRENYRTKVTFDPYTAYPRLVVSVKRTYVKSGGRSKTVLENPERFSRTPALLGLPGFTSGKHYWEVEYGDQREWAVGVALESVDRKGNLGLSPKEGIWQEGRWWLRALETRSYTSSLPPGIIGVFLDYEAGTVAFYTERDVVLKKASFNGEKVFPFFYVRRGVYLKLIQ